MTPKKYNSQTVAPLWKKENDYGEYFTSVPIDDAMRALVANAPEGASFVVRSLKDSARKNEKSPTHYLDIKEASPQTGRKSSPSPF